MAEHSRFHINGEAHSINIVGELPLTIKIDGRELVTLMTLGTHPEKLVLGYLRNQTLFGRPGEIASVRVDWERELAEVTTMDGNGATHMGFELAEELGITLIARTKSRQFTALNAKNLVFDQPPTGRKDGFFSRNKL